MSGGALGEVSLTPGIAVVLFIVMAVCGQAFRSNWKRQGPGWVRRAWLFAVPAATCLLILAFVPLEVR